MTSITIVIPDWFVWVVTAFIVVDIALSIRKLYWERQLRKAKSEGSLEE